MQGPESYPYYIMTPNYTSSSLGIQVMHYLCHLLNEKGHKAWLVNAKPNPAWNTPVLSDVQFNQHKEQGTPVIAIYPEIVSGNPLKAPVVVRYMLNREGVMNGNAIEAGHDDLFFWYRQEFAGKYRDPLLRLELYDLDLFCNDNPHKDLNLLYLNRIPESCVDFSKLPSDIEILSMRNPLSLEELATKLKRARVLYSFESSGTNALAILCGCPVVALTIKGFEKYAVTAETLKDTGAAGYAWDDHPDTLQHVQSSMGMLREKMLERRSLATEQLAFFITQTQSHAAYKDNERKKASLKGWLNSRVLPTRHPIFNLNKDVLPRLLIAVHVVEGEEEKLQQTLASIAGQTLAITVLVVGLIDKKKGMEDILYISRDNFFNVLSEQIEKNTFDWLHNVPAGAKYTAAALATLQTFLLTTKAHVICADEIWINQEKEDVAAFRSVIDWELYSHAPHLYLKRSVISRRGIMEVGNKPLHDINCYEFELICRINKLVSNEAIVVYPDVLIQLEEPQCSQSEAIENGQILKVHQQYIAEDHGKLSLNIGTSNELKPMVSVIMLAGNKLALIERTITGFLANNSWPNVEIVIVNHTHQNDILNQWIEGLATIDPESIRVLQIEMVWDPIALRNAAAEIARGQYFLFLDNQILFVTKNWLQEMMDLAIRPNIACVGPKIIGTNERILSAGVVIGANGNAEHIGVGEHWQSSALAGRLLSVRQQSYMDGQCLLVSRNSWRGVNGFDNKFSELVSAEIDLMFKLQQVGYTSLWTPNSIVALDGNARDYLPLYQNENTKMVDLIKIRQADVNYSVRHSLENPLFSAEQYLKSHWLADKQADLALIVFVTDEKFDHYTQRLSHQLEELASKRKITLVSLPTMPSFITLAKMNPNMLLISGDVMLPEDENIENFKQQTGCQFFYFVNDVLKNARLLRWLNSNVIDGWLVSHNKQQRWLETRKQKSIELLPMPSMVAASTDLLKVIPERPRVLCDARDLSLSDRKLMTEILAATSNAVAWVILGKVNPDWNQWIEEAHRVDTRLLSKDDITQLRIDVAVVIRTNNEENRFKDAYLQRFYLACGLPVFCSHVESFENKWPAVRVKNQVLEWRKVLSTSALVWKNAEKSLAQNIKYFHEDNILSAENFEALWQKLGVIRHDEHLITTNQNVVQPKSCFQRVIHK